MKKMLPFIMIPAIVFWGPLCAEAGEISFDLKSDARDPLFLNFHNTGDTAKVTDTPASLYPEYYLHDPVAQPEEAYGSFSLGDAILFRLGRQKYHTGTGRGWNPTDLFNLKSILDPMYAPEGIDSAYLSYSFGKNYEISIFYPFGNNQEDRNGPKIRNGDYQLRMKTHTNIADLAIHYTDVTRNRTDYARPDSGAGSDQEATIPVRWKLLATSLSTRIGGMGIHAEGGHAWLNLDDKTDKSAESIFAKDHYRFLVGIDYTFENELYLVLEYYQDGQDKTLSDEYALNDGVACFSNEHNAIGRDNVFLGAKYPLAGMTSIELYNVINANDPSMIVNPWLIWSTGDDFTIKFSAQFPVGSEESSLGQVGPSAFAHIQLNF